jgi:phosphatidylglycerophosphatase A
VGINILNKYGLRFLRWFVAGFGSGWLPKAPGTWGSLAALPIAYVVWHTWQVQGLFVATGLIYMLGCMACLPVLKLMVEQDPGWIVVDEWAGQWLCIAIITVYSPLTLGVLVACFVVFRLFDIWKPFPIRRLEHWGPAWWSIMFDDVVAGVMGAALLLVLRGVYHGL